MRKLRGFDVGILFALVGFFALITLPYLFAYMTQGTDHVFGGFLLNPIDGNSYLAKMYQGWQGEFRFRLPYTHAPNEGVFLFVFYLALGHLARIFHLPLILAFHLARLIAAGLLAWSLYRYVAKRFQQKKLDRQVFLLVLFGLGAGWIALPFGVITSDLWVAEGFPFLASYVNPHFPVGLAILTVLIFQEPVGLDLKKSLVVLLLAFFLAVSVPFGIVIIGCVLTLEIVLELLRQRRWQAITARVWQLVLISLVSGPVLIYDLWVVNSDPILSGWNAQNLTPSPPIWDFMLAFSPALLFSLLALMLVRSERDRVIRLAAIWLLTGIFLMYFPFGLQRRMISGLFIPAGILAMYWLASRRNPPKQRQNAYLLYAASLPSVVVIMLLAGVGILQKAPEIYLWRAERDAFNWLEAETDANSLVLAGPESGLLIPAYTGRRVFYGHPFETVDAVERYVQVNSWLQELRSGSKVSLPNEIDYIFWGPREAVSYDLSVPPLDLPVVYQNDRVTIFSAPDP